MKEIDIHNENDNEITIDFNKLTRMAWYRKNWSIPCYLIIILSTIIFTANMTKQYTSEASIMINKSSSTNLADINPYILAQFSSSGPSGLTSFFSNKSSINDEIELLKSPLVLDKVIKENNILYESGKKEGQYLTTDDFLEYKPIEFKNENNSNVIEIKYKSKSPKIAFNVVSSIINYYQEELKQTNSFRAKNDKNFIKVELDKTKKEISELLDELKHFKLDTGFIDEEYDLKIIASSNPYNRKIVEKIQKFPEIEGKGKSIQLKLESSISKYKMLKEKYEWSFLVEQLSQNATNITILKYPRKKEVFEKSEPSLKKNIIISVIVSIIFSSLLVIIIEIFDQKLSYYTINSNLNYWFDKNIKKNYIDKMLLTFSQHIETKSYKNLKVLFFNIKDEDIDQINKLLNPLIESLDNYKTFIFNDLTSPIELHKFVEPDNLVLLIGKIGVSNKDFFLEIENYLKLNNRLLGKIIIC